MARVSKDEVAMSNDHGLMVRDGSEFIIGQRFARTRRRLLTMRGGITLVAFLEPSWPGLSR
jgi:hypothetical protein